MQQAQQGEVQTAEQLLVQLVALLPHLKTVDERDMRMQGKLDLLLQLIHVLGSRCLASTDSQHLVHLLLTGVLHSLHNLRLLLQLLVAAAYDMGLVLACSYCKQGDWP